MQKEYIAVNESQMTMYMNSTLRNNKTTESNSIPANTWAYNPDLGLHYNVLNDASSNLEFNLGVLQAGDVVDVYAEVMVISGKTPQIAFNNPGISTINYTSVDKALNDGFNVVKLSSYNPTTEYKNVTVGLPFVEPGEGYIRNVRVVVTSKLSNLPMIYIPIAVRNTAVGAFEEWKATTNNLSSVSIDSENNRLVLTLKKQVRESYYLRPIVTFGADIGGASTDIYWRSSEATYSSLNLKAYKITDNTELNLSTLPPYNYVMMNLMFCPKDYDWTY